LAVQKRVIGALMLRELVTRFGRRNLGAMWLVAEPLIFTLAVAALWELMGLRRTSSVPVFAFAVTGYSSVLLWRNTVSQCTGAIQSNLNLLFHRNVKVVDVMLARGLLEVGGATAAFVVLSLAVIGLGGMSAPGDPLLVIAGWMMLAWFGLALALVVGSATAFSDLVARLWNPLGYVLFPLSGAVFLAEWIPPDIRGWLLLLPMVHGVELIREGWFGGVIRYHHDMAYMGICNLGLTLAGLWLVREAGRRAQAE
jgi:ABC-type polysaccharide/polyol phosphate export permease